jgi:hypothetical protein
MTGGEISGNTASSGGGVYFSGSGTFNMSGGEINGNTASSSSAASGGGVYVYGTFNMSGGEISGNTASSSSSSYSYGGGVYVSSSGTFTMSDGEISGNTAQVGGGVSVGGTFTMSGGEISGNTALSVGSYSYGGGVHVNGTFTMSGGEISGNTASSSSSSSSSSPYCGGVYVDGTFTMSGTALVNLNNPVYLATAAPFITIAAGGLTGTDPAALVELAPDPGFIGKPVLKWEEGGNGTLPVDRFKFAGGWTANSDAILGLNSLPLTAPGETAGAYLSKGSVHFYKFRPVVNEDYKLTHTRPSGSNIFTAAAWADGTGTLVTSNSTSGTAVTSNIFNANKPDLDIIIMVYNGAGDYTVKYEQQ